MFEIKRGAGVRITLIATFAIAAAAVLAALAFGMWAAARVDGQSLARQTHRIARVIETAYKKVPLDQQSVTVGDDSVIAAESADVRWLAENVGVGMSQYFGHDAAFVLDGHDAPIYAMEGGSSVAPAEYASVSSIVAPLVARLRARLATADASAIGSLGVEDFVDWGGVPAIVSVKPIAPASKGFPRLAGNVTLHVAVKKIDAQFLRTIAADYALDEPQLIGAVASPPAASVAIKNDAGATLAYFTWQEYRPGSEVFGRIAFILLILAALGAFVLILLLNWIWRATEELEASEKQARYLAFHDTLTGLPNRALLDERIEQALSEQHFAPRRLALFLLDIDHFKRVNDTQGHPAGDELVRAIGKRLTEVVGPDEIVARIGGDEFGLLVATGAGGDLAVKLAERVVAAIRQPIALLGEELTVTASLGIACSEQPGMGRAELLRRADIALYDAKARGGDGHSAFVDAMDELLRRRHQIEGDLRRALQHGNELWVAYQPVFAGDGRTLVGAEALVRWHHPTDGELMPDAFVGIAEERGLISGVSDFVIEQVCQFLTAGDFPWVAINVSAVQFHHGDFVETFLARLSAWEVSPQRIRVEITESALIEDRPEIRRSLNRLREAGIRIALDDFGTGYSSMNYLRKYPVDAIKIDRSFVGQLGNMREADAIVRAIVSMARVLGKEVVAEGVETVEQRDHLAALGCHQLQGYLLGRPMPAAEIMTFRLAAVAAAMRASKRDARRRESATIPRSGSRGR